MVRRSAPVVRLKCSVLLPDCYPFRFSIAAQDDGQRGHARRGEGGILRSYEGWQAWSVTSVWNHKGVSKEDGSCGRRSYAGPIHTHPLSSPLSSSSPSCCRGCWCGRLGSCGECTFAHGAREAHAVGTDDWPVIRKLKAAGKLDYADDEVRAGMDEIVKRGLGR